MKTAKNEFDKRDIAIAAVSFAHPAQLVRYQERHQWPFKILADPERKAYEAFNLPRLSWIRVFSPATLKLYFTLRRNGVKQEPYGGGDIYQAGGDFLIDGAGDILFAQRGKDPADRPTAKELLRQIDHIISMRGELSVDR